MNDLIKYYSKFNFIDWFVNFLCNFKKKKSLVVSVVWLVVNIYCIM